MRRCELAGADLDGLNREDKTLDLFNTRVVIDGKVVESDGKTAGSWQTVALDALTFGLLVTHMEMIKAGKGSLRRRLPGSRQTLLLARRLTPPPGHHHQTIPTHRTQSRTAGHKAARSPTTASSPLAAERKWTRGRSAAESDTPPWPSPWRSTAARFGRRPEGRRHHGAADSVLGPRDPETGEE